VSECAHEASMSMPMRLSVPVLAHETSMSMLMELSCAHAHAACTLTTTLGKSAVCSDFEMILVTHPYTPNQGDQKLNLILLFTQAPSFRGYTAGDYFTILRTGLHQVPVQCKKNCRIYVVFSSHAK
jgi:hypothetical protein